MLLAAIIIIILLSMFVLRKHNMDNYESQNTQQLKINVSTPSMIDENYLKVAEKNAEDEAEWEKSRHTKQDKPVYIVDTIADNNVNISMDVYKYPFVKPTSIDKYQVKNSDYVNRDGANESYKLIKACAEDYVKSVMSADYKTLKTDEQQYIKKAGENVDDSSGGFYDTDVMLMSHDDLMKESADWFINNEVQANADFKTDKSLIWCDLFYTYLRGELTITTHNIKDGSETYWPGTLYGLDYKNGGKYVAEFRMVTYDHGKSYQISDFSVLGKIDE